MQTSIVIPSQAGCHGRRSRRLSWKAVFMDSRLRGNDRKDDSPRIAALLHANGGGVGLAQQIRALLGDGEQQPLVGEIDHGKADAGGKHDRLGEPRDGEIGRAYSWERGWRYV